MRRKRIYQTKLIMKNSTIVSAKTAKGIREGRITAFIEPVKHKLSFEANDPKRTDLDAYGVLDKNGNYFFNRDHEPITARDICPFRIGQETYFLELWWSGYELDDSDIVDYAKPMTLYKADTMDGMPCDMSDSHCYLLFGHDKRVWPSWRSATTMPKSAARLFATIEDVKCMRVQDVDARILGYNTPSMIECVQQYYKYIIDKFGQKAWDNNIFVWLFKFNLKK